MAGIDQNVSPHVRIDKCMTKMPRTSLEQVSIHGFVRNVITLSPSKNQTRLQGIYRKMYSFEAMVLHSAEPDTLLLLDITPVFASSR